MNSAPVLPEHVTEFAQTVLGGPVVDVVPCTAGWSHQLSVLVGRGHRRAFVKWATTPDSARAIIREAAHATAFPAPQPSFLPKLLGCDPDAGLIAFEALEGTHPARWDAQMLSAADSVLDELHHSKWTGSRTLRDCDVLVSVDDAHTYGEPAGIRFADLDRFYNDTVDTVDGVIHGDPHTLNWVAGVDRLWLVDLDHMCRGPRQWDRVYLATWLPCTPQEAVTWLLADDNVDRHQLVACSAAATARLFVAVHTTRTFAAKAKQLCPQAKNIYRLLSTAL